MVHRQILVFEGHPVTTLLHVLSSPRGEASESRALSGAFVDAYVQSHLGTVVDTWDLWADPVPTWDGTKTEGKMAVFAGQEPTGVVGAAWAEVVAATNRFTAADLYVFSVPMWNSGIPWILKHFVDTVTQPGLTFGVDMEKGYFGLLKDKTAVSCYVGGVWTAGVGPEWGWDDQSTYFRAWLEFVGVVDNHELRFQPTIFPFGGPPGERRPVAHEAARALAAEL